MQSETAPPPSPILPDVSTDVAATRWLAVGSLLGLILLCLAWELWLAPLRPGGSYLALKALPLVLPMAGILSGRRYTYQWTSMFILAYFIEGVMRARACDTPRSAHARITPSMK